MRCPGAIQLPAAMAVGQVNKALENGYKVHVFFGLRGVLIAARTLMIDIGTAAAMSLRQQLQAAGEGRLGAVGPMCLS